MTPALHDQILSPLLADEKLEATAVDLVDAACRGEGALTAALEEAAREPGERKPSVRPPATKPAAAYLKSIEVAGFRGIGQACTFTTRGCSRPSAGWALPPTSST